jgi:AraC family transcriptional regulator of adaptative response/methylated-DNA-[protein]-cysteine methyltransferase
MLLHLSTDDEGRWAAVQNRDISADGRFVYAVASTRIYCRPSCPSRRPHRRHVQFFHSPAEAEAEGYRACRRCQPREPETAVGRRIRAAQTYLEQHLDETVTLERLGREVRMSPYHLQRTFKRLTGITPRGYASARRLEQMKSRLKEGKSVTRATYDAGYSSPSRAYDHSRARLGMTPTTYRRGGQGVRIAYSVIPTDAGQLLVAGTERGICAVTLGDDTEALEAALRAEYPLAELERGNGELDAWTRAVVDHLEGVGGTELLPLDVRGTAFQRKVWEALQRIPRGTTRSYTEIARELGQPAAARAVAQACASNRLALVIPCHRVVREDGGLGGYRWGIERKRALLERERSAS